MDTDIQWCVSDGAAGEKKRKKKKASKGAETGTPALLPCVLPGGISHMI